MDSENKNTSFFFLFFLDQFKNYFQSYVCHCLTGLCENKIKQCPQSFCLFVNKSNQLVCPSGISVNKAGQGEMNLKQSSSIHMQHIIYLALAHWRCSCMDWSALLAWDLGHFVRLLLTQFSPRQLPTPVNAEFDSLSSLELDIMCSVIRLVIWCFT